MLSHCTNNVLYSCFIYSQVDYRAKVWSCNFCFQRNQVMHIVFAVNCIIIVVIVEDLLLMHFFIMPAVSLEHFEQF